MNHTKRKPSTFEEDEWSVVTSLSWTHLNITSSINSTTATVIKAITRVLGDEDWGKERVY